MCSIAGFYNFKTDFREKETYHTKVLTDMQLKLSHRGTPNYYVGKHIVMSQCISSCNYALAFDGEIYNAKELTDTLKAAGYRLTSPSHAEILLYSYLHFGPEFVKELNGVFAIALYDFSKETLYLYRDRIGAKPLFYCQNDNLRHTPFAFASEPKALFAHPDISPEVTLDSFREIFAIGPARTSGNGIFKHIYEVIPGHYLSCSKSGISDHSYWDLTIKEHTDNYSDTVENVSYLIRDAIKRQSVSDAPLCTFLSGGIDSSIVTSLAFRYLKEQGTDLQTFSFDFKENDKYFKSNSFQPERDLPYIKCMLSHYPTRHTFLECDEIQLTDALYDAVDARDYPGMGDIDASLLYFCALVKEQSTVALTGECADEIFGGYPWFYRQELLHADGFPWSHNTEMRTLFLKEDIIEMLDIKNYAYDRYQSALSKAPICENDSAEARRRCQIAYLNIKWFMQTLLDRMDRTGMHSGLKARVPFADHRIIEYVFHVPWEMKYQNNTEKSLLRDACKDLLPPELLHRKKSPYPKTYHPGYEQLLTRRFLKILQDKTAPITPFLDTDKVVHFLSSPTEYGQPWYGQLMAGPQLIAYFIQINYWMKHYAIELPK